MPDQFITASTQDHTKSEPFEVGEVQWVRRPGEGGREELAAGYWFITPAQTPGPMVVEAHADETIYIIEGRVRIEPEGSEAFEVAAGGSASMNKGVSATWTVLEPTVEFFVYS
ncbi:hypothetical protein SRABI76_01428 [Microbacterium oxydans]|uniref:cupin domain-containing protein n=1 Tax=Microbacterium oxydans TaxID=82380 RepID=UPI001D248E1B|nr:cupin domain-containing protein [Microbacterium oxydans]CAH0176987.1 hypothetical protein SRABI76_01428 [Microbacterium oxydans]